MISNIKTEALDLDFINTVGADGVTVRATTINIIGEQFTAEVFKERIEIADVDKAIESITVNGDEDNYDLSVVIGGVEYEGVNTYRINEDDACCYDSNDLKLVDTDRLVIEALENMFLSDTDLFKEREAIRDEMNRTDIVDATEFRNIEEGTPENDD